MNGSRASPVRVLVVAESAREHGGVERFASDLANGLLARGFDVTLGTVDTPREALAYPVDPRVDVVSDSARPLGAAVESGGRWRRLRITAMRWRVARGLARVASRVPHDVVVLNGLVTACCLLLARPREAPCAVCCDHNHFEARSSLWQRLRARFYPRAAAVVSLSRADLPRYRALNPRSTVIGNSSALRADAPSPAVGTRLAPRVLAVGRFVAQKGFDRLLAAWPQVVAAVPDATLRIVGDGPLRPTLAALAAEHASVRLVPPTVAIEAEYRAASLFVLPSRYEGMPLALLEAQALGLPAVAYDCPTGPSDVLVPETGTLVPEGDVEALATALCELLADPARRTAMGRAAIARAREHFAPERQMDAWAEVIRAAASRVGTAA